MGRRAGNGEGSIYKRKSDGRWIGAVPLGYDENGKPKRKTVSGRTREEVAKKKRALEKVIDEGLPPPDSRITVGQFLDIWLEDVVPLRVGRATAANYKSVVETHIKPALGRKRLSKVTTDDLQRFLRSKLDEGLSPRTVRLFRTVLVLALDVALRQGRVPGNVAKDTDGPLLEHGKGRSLTQDQAKTLIKGLKGERLEAMYLLRLITGIRPGEAFALSWSNIDLEGGSITINRGLSRQPGGNVIGYGKTGEKGWRTIPIEKPMVEALRAHRARQEDEREQAGKAWNDNDLVFCTPIGTPLDPDNERKEFHRIVETAGLGDWAPNELRHSAASLMLANSVSLEVVSEILGHTSIRITKDVYGHIGRQQLEGAAKAMANALFD